MRNGGGEGKEDVILMFNKLILLKEVLFFHLGNPGHNKFAHPYRGQNYISH